MENNIECVFNQMTVILNGMHIENKPRNELWKKGTKCIAKNCLDAIFKNAYSYKPARFNPDDILMYIFWIKSSIVARYKIYDEENRQKQYRVLFKDRSYIDIFYYYDTNDIRIFYRNAGGGTSYYAEKGLLLSPVMPERWFESGVF